ncbi:MAG TPA: hypothetical protein VLB67_00440 [Acidimicrobiia bacterium]|nr:hypothetical protein [Acidimicrobiia bacterium]
MTEETRARFEVLFFLDTDSDAVAALERRWALLGDSVIVSATEGGWRCHIHTDHIGAAIDAALEAGRPRELEVTDLSPGVGGFRGHHPDFRPHVEAAIAPVGVVAVASGPGIVSLFREALVQGVVSGSRPMQPTVDELVETVEAVPAQQVVLLPNSRIVVPIADEVDALTTKDVTVVPTRSVPQGVAAMLGYSTGEESLEDAAQTMSAAASSIISAQLSQASRDARVPGVGRVAEGDWVGWIDGTPAVSGSDPWTALTRLIRRIMTAPIELVTAYAGADADPEVMEALPDWIRDEYPDAVTRVVDGGQPLHPYLLSFE